MHQFRRFIIYIAVLVVAWWSYAFGMSQLPVVASYAPPSENELEASCSVMVELFTHYQAATIDNNHVIAVYLSQLALATTKYSEYLDQFEGQATDFELGQFQSVEKTATNTLESVENLYSGDEVLSNFFYELLEVLPECLTAVGDENIKPLDQDLLEALETYRSDATEIESGAAMFVEQKATELEALATQLSAVEGRTHRFAKGSFAELVVLANEFNEASQLTQSSASSVERSLLELVEQIKKRLEGMGSLGEAS